MSKSNGVSPKKYLKLRDIGKGTYSKVFTVQIKQTLKFIAVKKSLNLK